MSDYTQITDFSAKDALSSGDPEKIILGSDIDAEFAAITTAIATKYDSDDLASQAQAEALTSNLVLLTPGRLANVLEDNGGMLGDIQALTDPGADTLLGWDDSASAVIGFTLGAGLSHASTELNVADAIAGAGLTISSSILAVGAGSGITVNADDVQLANASVGTTQAIQVASGVISLVPTSLTQLTGAGFAGADEFLVWDADAAAIKAVQYQDFGIPVVDDATTTPFSAADLTYANKWYSCSNGSAISAVIPANASIAYPIGTVFAFYQAGAGQVTVSVTSDTLRAPNGAKTSSQYATIFATKVASTTWVITGDASA